jgi:predicted ABC-type ATPase
MPSLYIITGSNGAGKSTVGPDYLPEEISQHYTVFNGDLLYTRKLNELFPAITMSAKYERKPVLQEVEFHVEREELPAWFTNHLPAILQLFP